MTPQEERWLEIGKAIDRACEVLPDGCDLHIELERGAGGVRLYLPNVDACLDDFCGDTFGAKIDNAIGAALDHCQDDA